jgi:hypothetical protein
LVVTSHPVSVVQSMDEVQDCPSSVMESQTPVLLQIHGDAQSAQTVHATP